MSANISNDEANISNDEFLSALAIASPFHRELQETYAQRIISKYINYKKSQGVVISDCEKITIPLQSHGIFIMEINRHELLELGIIPEVMEMMVGCFTQKMGLKKIDISRKKPMPAYREWAFAKHVSDKYRPIKTYDDTTHIIINF